MSNLELMIAEFRDFSLDPEEVNQQQLMSQILFLQHTMDLSSPANIKMANATIASITQLVFYKLARTQYWYDILENKVKSEEAIAGKAAYHGNSLSKAELDIYIASNDSVIQIRERMTKAYAAYRYWENIAKMLGQVSFRIDSSEKAIAAESRVSSNLVRS